MLRVTGLLFFLISFQTYAGPPLLNCAIPLDVAEVARQFSTYEHCLRYYTLKSGCDPRCQSTFESLCHAATDEACTSLNLPTKDPLDAIY